MMMKKVLKINNDLYNVDVAISKAELYRGLSGTESLAEDEGMLFLFTKNTNKNVFMVMRDMQYPLDFVFIKDNKIVDLKSAEKDSKEKIKTESEFNAILEINKGKSKDYKIGDEVSISDKEVSVKKEDNKIKHKYSFSETGEVVAVREGIEIKEAIDEEFYTPYILNQLETEYETKKKKLKISFKDYIKQVKSNPHDSIIYNAYKAYETIKSFKGGGDLTYNEKDALKIGDVKYNISIKDVPLKNGCLHVLDNDGNVVYNLKPGSRIFSILDTKDLVNSVLSVKNGGNIEDLGKLVINILNKHDKQSKQFVKK